MTLELFGRARTFGLVLIAVGVAAACSAGSGSTGNKQGPVPGGGAGGSTASGAGPGNSGTAGTIFDFGGAPTTGGGSGGASVVVHTACTKNEDCADPKAVCVKPGPESGITEPGECAPSVGACGADDVCAQDSYC